MRVWLHQGTDGAEVEITLSDEELRDLRTQGSVYASAGKDLETSLPGEVVKSVQIELGG